MNPKYLQLPHDPLDMDADRSKRDDKGRQSHSPSSKDLLVMLLLATNIFLVFQLLFGSIESPVPDNYAKVEPLKTTWNPIWWNTEYSPKNHSESDDLWEAILPSHGLVAVDRIWAAERQWPVSMYLPSDHSKGVYLLEAYHQLHCLRILRKTFWEAIEHRPLTYHPSMHMEHCFDTIRQYVQCNADNTPLYTFGDNTAGDGQIHRCRDWTQLREFATRNTACYRDTVEEVPLEEHFGFCDNGSDGLFDIQQSFSSA